MPKISENTGVEMPIRNLVSIIIAVAVGVWAYFGIIERLNKVETELIIINADLEKNTEFRIKWPRGEMGSLPADSEQFMLIEHLAGQLQKLTTNIETGKAPFDQQQKLTLDYYEMRIKKLEDQLDKLKDKVVNGKH
tara:strand:+ start:188 stop:595 length:408 start_codon:yes stop_codon:yes gene_type:complete